MTEHVVLINLSTAYSHNMWNHIALKYLQVFFVFLGGGGGGGVEVVVREVQI